MDNIQKLTQVKLLLKVKDDNPKNNLFKEIKLIQEVIDDLEGNKNHNHEMDIEFIKSEGGLKDEENSKTSLGNMDYWNKD